MDPLNLKGKVLPLLTQSGLDTLTSEGSLIIGVHSSFLSDLEKIRSPSDVVFNVDEPYIACKKAPVYPDEVIEVFSGFQNVISSFCKHSKPAFPAAFVSQEIHHLVITLIAAFFNMKNTSFSSISEEWNLRVSQQSHNYDVMISKSFLMRQLMDESSKQNCSPEFLEAFWPDGTADKRATRKKAMTISLGRIPKSKRVESRTQKEGFLSRLFTK